jgi:hypothetical protein
MATYIINITPTTELEAVNVMLEAIGAEPLLPSDDINTRAASDANVEVAMNILRETTRECLAAGWRFNALTGFEVAPTATYSWVDTAGVTTLLNVFKVPAEALAWTQTRCRENWGIELIERKSLKYTEASSKVKVLFDRVKNRDGVQASAYPHVYLDYFFAVDFEDMPECARRFVAVVSARRLAARVPGSDTEVAFQKEDELAALRVLKREQGLVQTINMFDTAESYDLHGRRQSLTAGYAAKVYPGGT